MYVLDTNTLIYFFKGAGKVAERLLSIPPKEIAIPSVVIYELELGIAKSSSPKKRSKQLSELTSVVQILPFAIDEAKMAATIRTRLEKQGTPIGPLDVLIAGTAIAQRGILITNNVKEFGRVRGLRVENWFK